VVLDLPSTDDSDIWAHPSLPRIGDTHPDYGWLFVWDRRLRKGEEESRLIVDVEIEYRQVIVDDDTLETVLQSSQPQLFTNPEFRPPTKTWRTAEVIRPLRRHQCTTRNGELRNSTGVLLQVASDNFIVNTAGEPPTDPPQYRAFNRVFTLTRYEDNYDESLSDLYLGRVNSSTFKGKPEYTVMCTLIDAENKYVQSGNGLRELALVTYQFEYDRFGHWEDIPNVSLKKWDGTESVAITVDDENGNQMPIATPMFLDETGDVIPEDDIPGAEVWIRTYPYEEADFDTLGL
jgi:hypothetical protein